jgi:serine/threonine-protein kinase
MTHHPNIVAVYEVGLWHGTPYIVQELLDGETLRDCLVREHRLTPTAAIEIMVPIMGALAAAHRAGIVHRDLKPENVLIDRYGRWRLADFGIANATGEEVAGASGTPAFAPPEQLLGEEQDAAADCFSLAAIVAYALSGSPPFGERDSAAILARELRGDVDLSAYPPELAEWLRRGLAASADARFEDAAAMQTAWRDAVGALLDQDRQLPWWRRWFAGEDADGGTSWTGDSFFSN